MKNIVFIVAFLAVSPAFAQSRVFTNADLGKPLSRGSVVKADQAAAVLAPYQFVDVAPREWFMGPTVTVLNSSPTAGPFGEFEEFSPTPRLYGPFVTAPPWSVMTYPGYSYPGRQPYSYPGRQRYSYFERQRYSFQSGMPIRGYLLPSHRQLGSWTTTASGGPQRENPGPATPRPGASGRGHRQPGRD